MRLAKHAQVLFIASGVSLLLAFVGIFWSVGYMREELRQFDLTASLLHDVMNLDSMSHELLFAQHERGVVQWRRAYGRMERRLESVGSSRIHEQDLYAQLLREQSEMAPIFDDFIRTKPQRQPEVCGASRDAELFLVGQLRIRLATIMKISELWQERSMADLRVALLVGGIFSIFSTLLAVVVLLLWTLALRRADSLKELRGAHSPSR